MAGRAPADPLAASPGAARSVAARLRAGGTAVVPAEGVYGLVADAAQEAAISRLYSLKGREARKPMLVLVPSADAADALALELPAVARELLSGPDPLCVTVLLAACEGLDARFVGPAGTVAVRRPGDAFQRALLAAVGGPVVSTSANRAGEPAPRTLGGVPAELRRSVDVVVDAGTPLSGRPSTIVAVEGDALRVVRSGSVPADALQHRLGCRVREAV